MNQQRIATRGKHSVFTFNYIPIIGIIIFLLIFFYSSTLYPGGSQADITSQGFSWIDNYWCNLMNTNAINGQLNPARPWAISAMLILCLSLLLFFIQFAQTYCEDPIRKKIISISGVIAMFFASLIFTSYHDLFTIISSLFGVIVVIGITLELFRNSLNTFKYFGLICIFLLGINNYIYYTGQYIEALPLLQKTTFAAVLWWVGLMTHYSCKNLKSNS